MLKGFLIAALAVSSFLGPLAFAFPEDPTYLNGTFLASVDDHATVFVNGANVFHADLGTSRSHEVKLSVGDRVVVHLTNDQGPKHFILVFESADAAWIVSFRASDYRIVQAAGVKDVSASDFAQWTQQAKKYPGHKGLEKQLKNYSEWVWGDLDHCTIACIVTQKMISQRPR